MESYSKKNNVKFEAKAANKTGYRISKDNGENWNDYYVEMLDTSDSLYVISSKTDAYSMWLASPSAYNSDRLLGVNCKGYVNYHDYDDSDVGFRTVVCLKSNVEIEKILMVV